METLNLEQRRSLEEVDQYRRWWQQYDRIMEVVTESSSSETQISPHWIYSPGFVLWVMILCVAVMLTVLIHCRNRKERKKEVDLISRQSPPPPYSVVVQVKDDQDGLPTYTQACSPS